MNKIIFTVILLIFATTAFATESWTTSFGEGAPSCSLYRKRVANYYNRINEFQLALKVVNSNLTPREIARLVELTTRSGIPLFENELATWKVEIPMGEISDKLKDSLSKVEVSSTLFNWESDKFIFPSDIMNVSNDELNKSIKIELTSPFAYACLQAIDLDIVFNWKDGTQSELHFLLDKTKWDSENP
jgi:hypothetical protein